jgi:SAM-dependent methyltransferase
MAGPDRRSGKIKVTEQDRSRWNEKYRTEVHPSEAAEVVKKFYHLAPAKTALDIAAGNGRHSLFLARKGFTVDAVDISEVGLSGFASRHPGIRTICADLDQFDIPPSRYDLIINVKFLNRRLYPYLQEGLRPGGVLIFHSLLEMDGTKRHPEHCRDYLLRKNELLHAFLTLRIIFYREAADPESEDAEEMATLVAVKR